MEKKDFFKEFPFVTQMIDTGTGRILEMRTQIRLPEFEVYKVGGGKWVCAKCGNILGSQAVAFDAFGGDPEEPFVMFWFVCNNGCIPKPPQVGGGRIMIKTKQVCTIQCPTSF